MSDGLLWERLERSLTGRIATFPGVAGITVRDLRNGNILSINGGKVFPTASTIKIHVLTQLLVRAERKELDLGTEVTITPEMRAPGSGLLAHLHGDVELTLLNLAVLMITLSDNTATNLCIDMAGMAETNALLLEMGLEKTKLRRKMLDTESIARGDENVSTPDECVAMLELLYKGRPSEKVAGQCLEILKSPKEGPLNKALSGVPLANKPGYMGGVYCDAGIVYLPRRPYAVAIMSKFGLTDPLQHERDVIDMARDVHRTMVALDTANEFGLTMPS